MDWNRVRTEYINGDISYAKLAKKHNISLQALKDRGAREKWVEQRKKQHAEIQQRTNQKTAEKLAEREANRLMRMSNAADTLLEKIELATEQLDQFITISKARQKEIGYNDMGKPDKENTRETEEKRIVKVNHLDRAGIKQLASALKDLKDIQFTANEENERETPNISINITSANADDSECE